MEDMQIESQDSNDAPPPPLTPPPPVPITNGNSVMMVDNTADGGDSYVFSGKVVQVTNVSTGATLQQIATLFGFIGTVTDIRMYPTAENPGINVKLCYIKYENSEQCGVAQHLTNTVFIDKPLIVVPMNREEIPEEAECQNLIKTINAYATAAGTGFLPQYFPPNDSTGIPGLPPPPIITSTTDPVEIDEIKKTIFVENIANDITSEQLMAFFSGIGEVKYLRYSKKEKRHSFIEFSNLESVPTALQYNGVLFGGKCLKVQYSKSAIIKPESERIASGRNGARKSTRDAVKRPSSNERDTWDSTKPRVFTSRSRSRSKSRTRRSRSKDRRRRSRTRSKSPRRPRRSRSRSASRRKRRSRSRSRSMGKSRRKSRTRSKSRSPRKRRSRSRSRERRRRSRRSPSKSTSRSPKRRSKKKSKSKSPSPQKKKSSRKSRSRSRSPNRSSSKKKRKDKDKDKEKEKDKERDKEKSSSKKEKSKDKEVEEKELKNLLTKIYTFEEEKEKEKKEKNSDD